MFYDIYSLENSLMNNEFEHSIQQFDTYKLIEALKFLTQKVKDLEAQTLVQQTEQLNQQSEYFKLQENYAECKHILRKMSKDYPELVIANPKFFSSENVK